MIVEHWPGPNHADLWLFPRPATDGEKYQPPIFLSGAVNDATGKNGTWN